jgi:hypothetical protein
MFIALQFTIDNLWKQPRGPTTDEWIKKLWYTYTMEFYLAIREIFLKHIKKTSALPYLLPLFIIAMIWNQRKYP